MKIRTDFVTNSSSSSFVAVTVSAKSLDKYLKENGIENFFEQLGWHFEEGEIVQAELDKSMAQSLIAISEKIAEDMEFGGIDEDSIGADEDALKDLIKFLKKNKDVIDAEAEGNIEIKYSCGEDGFAYAQSLEYKKHHGKLVKWPCSDGWNMDDGGGYEKIEEFNSKMFNGEIRELADLAYDAIWDIVWDEEALATAAERTGVTEEFDVKAPAKKVTANFEKDYKLEDIDPVNTEWINGAIFVFTGLEKNDESIATDIVEDNGGEIKGSVVLKTNFVIYNPYYDHETTKLKKAKELIAKGKPISLLTVSEFCKRLISDKSGNVTPQTKKQTMGIISTIKDCNRVFDCYVSRDRISIRGIKKSVAEVIIPGNVEGLPVEVEQGAFNKNKKIEKLVFSEGVIEIGADCFNDCKQLQEVTFAGTIKKVGSGVFSNTPWRKKLGDWLVINHILVEYSGKDTSVSIPDGIRRINEFAFSRNWDIKSVVIPDSVEYIGNSAFSCRNLKDIQLPEHDIEFGSDPFSGSAWSNAHADWVVVNGTLIGVSDDYYYGTLMNSDSISVPEGVKVIGNNAFMTGIREWNQVKCVYLPEGLRVIGDEAFSGFSCLEEVSLPSTVVHIGDEAFQNCAALKKINFPEGLITIGKSAFSGWSENNKIEEIILPDSVTTIGDHAFARCEQLRKLRLPKRLQEIPDALVHSCNNLEEVIMPVECKAIKDDAFESCEKVTRIELPSNLSHLGRRVFYGCSSIKELKLPVSVREFGWATFKRCSSVESIIIPEGVTELPEELFEHCSAIKSITVPVSVKSIEENVFNDCPQLTVRVYEGSFAEKYMIANAIKYALL